ncbi:RDD family protein [Streptomyces purpurogeneiscleroticus]|uniref:RDD family protein n=1 Tax=Streptomyces purpurogeneiscleroticus TaxID=68259 RepID=UPI001CBCC2F4|nr:RDD family protein [Streptomyces purpurogeneiscleroticus]
MTGPRRQDDPVRMQGRAAGLVSRTVAALIDTFAVLGIGLAALLAAGAVRFMVAGPPFALPHLPPRISTACGAALAVGYLAGGWLTAGRTAGARLMGLRVAARSGRPLGPGRALLRAALCVAFPWGLLWIPVSRHGRSLQDLVVASVVVHDWHGRTSPVPGDAARRARRLNGTPDQIRRRLR